MYYEQCYICGKFKPAICDEEGNLIELIGQQIIFTVNSGEELSDSEICSCIEEWA